MTFIPRLRLPALPGKLLDKLPEPLRDNAEALRVLHAVGILDRNRLVPLVKHLARSGVGTGAAVAAQAETDPDGTAIIDEFGTVTWSELHVMGNALAHRLVGLGVEAGDGVAIMMRNSRWFTVAECAASRIGGRILYMNTGFAAPQFAEVFARERGACCLYDDEFEAVIAGNVADDRRLVGHSSGESTAETIADAVATGPTADLAKPKRPASQIILTSGTTGTPKGANRGDLKPDLINTAAIFTRIPYRVGSTFMIAAPMFHAWGLAHQTLAIALGSTMVMRRRFDPEATMRLVDEHRCDTMAAVPVMLQRILALPDQVRASFDTSSLRIVASSGSALPGSLAIQWMDTFGDNLHNMFGSTEVAFASIATPQDLRRAPGTAGRPPLGVTVRLYDDDGQPVETPGDVGRIFVGNKAQFQGYTGGGDKERIDGLMSIGDLGYFDDQGRLFVGGRDDDMIVSGGENVFPSEIENLLIDHPLIADVAVVGVDDDEFGTRLAAFVVVTPAAELDEAAVKSHVKANLAGYKVPRDITFVDELPRNHSGKVLKRELRTT